MGVFSYPEMYTTIFGWTLYGVVWNILAITGIAWIPFLLAIYQNTREPMEAQEARDATQVSIRRMAWSLGVMILVVSLCVVPSKNMAVNTITFTCQPTAATPSGGCVDGVSYGSSGTAYDTAPLPGMVSGATGSTVELPVFWAGLSTVSSGLINAMVSKLPQRSGIREVQAMMAAANIGKPELRSETQRFTRECYVPAMNKYEGFLAGHGTSRPDIIQGVINNNALDAGRSMDFIGNKVLTETMGLYTPCPSPDICGSTLKASTPVPGFESHPNAPDGIPNCRDWWSSLRDKLKDEAAAHASGGTRDANAVVQMISNAMASLGVASATAPQAQYEDLLIQQAAGMAVATAMHRVDHEVASGLETYWRWTQPGMIMGMYDGSTQAEIKSTVLSAGLASEKFSLVMKMPLIMKAAPLVQSVLIMVMIALIPIVMVVGRYSLGTLVACGIGYFTVRFWTFLWALAAWVDELLTAMFAGNQAMNAVGNFSSNDAAMTFARYSLQMTEYQMESVVQLTTAALFVGMPAIFTMLLGWAGAIGISGLNEGMRAMSSSTENAGSRADQGSRAVAAGAVSVAGAAQGAALSAAHKAASGAAVAAGSRAISDMTRR